MQEVIVIFQDVGLMVCAESEFETPTFCAALLACAINMLIVTLSTLKS